MKFPFVKLVNQKKYINLCNCFKQSSNKFVGVFKSCYYDFVIHLRNCLNTYTLSN